MDSCEMEPGMNTDRHGCGRRSWRICLCAGWWDEHRCRVGRHRGKPQANVPLKESARWLEMIGKSFKGRIEWGYAVRCGPSCAAPGCRPGAEHVQEAEHKNNHCVPRTPKAFCVFCLGLLGPLFWSNSHEASLHRRLLRAIRFRGRFQENHSPRKLAHLSVSVLFRPTAWVHGHGNRLSAEGAIHSTSFGRLQL